MNNLYISDLWHLKNYFAPSLKPILCVSVYNITGQALSALWIRVFNVKKRNSKKNENFQTLGLVLHISFLPGRTVFKMHLLAKFMSGERTHSQFPNAIWNEKFKDVAERVCDLLWSFLNVQSGIACSHAHHPPLAPIALFYFESIDSHKVKWKTMFGQ